MSNAFLDGAGSKPYADLALPPTREVSRVKSDRSLLKPLVATGVGTIVGVALVVAVGVFTDKSDARRMQDVTECVVDDLSNPNPPASLIHSLGTTCFETLRGHLPNAEELSLIDQLVQADLEASQQG